MGLLVRGAGRGARAATVLLALFLAPPAARGQPAAGPAASLGRGVPSDAAVYIHARLDASGPLAQRLGSLRAALESSGFGEHFRRRLLATVYGDASDSTAEQKTAFRKRLESEIQEWQDAAAALDWWGLLARESVIAARSDGEQLDWLLLVRIDPGARDGLIANLRRLIHVLASAGRDLEEMGSSRDGEFVSVLYRNPDAKPGSEEAVSVLYNVLAGVLGRGLEISVAATGDVLLFATSRSLLARSLQLLAGEGSDLGYAHAARREDLLARLPALPAVGAETGALEVHVRPGPVFAGLPAAAGVEDFVLRGRSDGKSFAYAYRADAAAPDRKGSEAARAAVFERPGALDLLPWVPADAASFHVSSGVEPRTVLAGAGMLLGGLLPAALLEAPEVETWAELSAAVAGQLTGRRVFLSDESGWVVLFEPAGSFRWHADLAPRVQSVLESLEGDLVAKEIEAGAGQVLRFSKDSFTCLTGYARGVFFLGSSEVLLGRALAARAAGAPVTPERRAVLEPPGLPPGDLRRAGDSRIGTLFPAAAGAFALLARAAAAQIEAEDDPFGKALLESLPRLAPAIDALSFADRLVSRCVRQGDALLGAGTITFGDPQPPRKEF